MRRNPFVFMFVAGCATLFAAATGHPRAATQQQGAVPLPAAAPPAPSQRIGASAGEIPPRSVTSGRAQADEDRALVEKYCVTCHNQRAKTAGLMLDTLDLGSPAAGAEVWEKVIRKVRGGLMPPVGMPRPDKAALAGFASYLETAIDKAAAAHPNPGRPVLHRLNRSEYGNAIRDLLALDVDVASLLPPDEEAYGFDNIADVLGVSPALMERYLSASWKIASLAVGDPKITPTKDTFRVRGDLSQHDHIEGLPVGTRGGILIRYQFPVDAEYVISPKLYRETVNIIRGLELPHDLEITFDGERVHLARFGGRDDELANYLIRPRPATRSRSVSSSACTPRPAPTPSASRSSRRAPRRPSSFCSRFNASASIRSRRSAFPSSTR